MIIVWNEDILKNKRSYIKLNAIIFNQVLKAWADSSLPEAPDKMELLLQKMRTEGVDPDLFSYAIMLRFYGSFYKKEGAVVKTEAILETMKQQGLEPDSVCLASCLYCFAKAGQLRKAENVLEQMMNKIPDNNNYLHLLGEGVQHILTAYRQRVASEKVPNDKKMLALNTAAVFFHTINLRGVLDTKSEGELEYV